MDEAEIRKNLQNGFKNLLKHTLFYEEVKILRTRGIDEIEKIRGVVKKALEVIENEKNRIKDNENKVLDDARKKGKREGLEQFKNIIKSFIDEKERLLIRIEESLMKEVILISEKVLEKELSINPSCILSIIKNEIRKLYSDNITLLFNKEELAEFKDVSPEFFEEVSRMNIAILGDESIKHGECLLKCDSGEIDLGVKKRLTKLREILDNGY